MPHPLGGVVKVFICGVKGRALATPPTGNTSVPQSGASSSSEAQLSLSSKGSGAGFLGAFVLGVGKGDRWQRTGHTGVTRFLSRNIIAFFSES